MNTDYSKFIWSILGKTRFRLFGKRYLIPFLNHNWIKFTVPLLIFVFTAYSNVIEKRQYHQVKFLAGSIDPATKTFILGEIDQFTPIIEERRDVDRISILEEGDEFTIRKPTLVYTEFTEEEKPAEPSQRGQAINHLVQPGETLGAIGMSYGLKIKTLLAANQSLKNADALKVGDKIIIPIEDYDPKYADKLIAKKEAKFERKSTTTGLTYSKNASLKVSGDGCIKPVSYTYVSRRLSSYHKGVDMIAGTGTAIYASCPGKIGAIGSGWSGGFGNYVKVSQDNGDESIYAHMSTISADISPGQYVTAGTYLGGVGSTGRSTGSHLHFEVRRHRVAVDYGF